MRTGWRSGFDLFRAEILYSRQRSDELFKGRREVSNPNEVSTTFEQETLHLRWRAGREFEWNLLVPRVEIHNEEIGKADVDLEGLGDASLFLEWEPWKEEEKGGGESPFRPAGLGFLAGLKLPTGEESKSPAPGATPPTLLQLGTGTYDPLFGLWYSAPVGDFILSHRTTAQLSGGASEAGLKPGNLLQTSTAAAYPLSDPLHASVGLEGIFRGKDVLNGDRIGNTGSSFWFLAPGVSARLSSRLQVEGSVRIPLYRNVDQRSWFPASCGR